MLGMLKAIRAKTGRGPGDTIEVVVWKDEELRTVEVPAQFETLLRKEGLLPVFRKLSYTHRKEYCRWITDAKKEETRSKRLAKTVAMLKRESAAPASANSRAGNQSGFPIPPLFEPVALRFLLILCLFYSTLIQEVLPAGSADGRPFGCLGSLKTLGT
jgi:hypothetical protein